MSTIMKASDFVAKLKDIATNFRVDILLDDSMWNTI